MTEKEILANNYLIKSFMGKDDEHRFLFDQLSTKALYHLSYDWLMPVCKKIYSLGYDVDINSNLRRINMWKTDEGFVNDVPDYSSEFRGNKSHNKDLTDTECLFLALVEFIKWYNENKDKK